MAHFAELNSNNIVRRVIVVNNKELCAYRLEHLEPTTIEVEESVETGEVVTTTTTMDSNDVDNDVESDPIVITEETPVTETQTVTKTIPRSQYVPYECEDKGIAFCQSLFGEDTVWKQTSYNGNFRKNFAGKGFKYDEDRDAFIAPQPFSKWVLNEDTCRWEAPVAYPDDGEEYVWNDNKGEWELKA
jgi:hypothetical protein